MRHNVIRLLESNDGRDKACKVIQYSTKLVLAFHPRSKTHLGPLAKELSATRRILRLFRFLSFPDDWNDALEDNNNTSSRIIPAVIEILIGTCGEIMDDACWASDMNLLPSWISQHDKWADYLWVMELSFALPRSFRRGVIKYMKFQQCSTDKRERHKAKVSFVLAWMNLIKRLADFFHATRLAFNWPTKSKKQDAVCGLISACIALCKLWQPTALCMSSEDSGYHNES